MTTSEIHPPPAVRPKILGLPVDAILLVAVGGLLAFGLMMVYSSTFDWSYRQFGDPAYIFMRQLRWLGLGLVPMLAASHLLAVDLAQAAGVADDALLQAQPWTAAVAAGSRSATRTDAGNWRLHADVDYVPTALAARFLVIVDKHVYGAFRGFIKD